MPRIRIEPSGIEYEAKDGDTIMGAALACGYYWPSSCGGEGRCTTCAVIIKDGQANVEEIGRSERKALIEQRSAAGVKYRLACQTRLHGDIVVEKFGVRPVH